MTPSRITLREALTRATGQLSGNQDLAPTASRDAELLLLQTLALPRTALYADPDRPLSEAELAACDAAISRRLGLEPVQYITGAQEFFGLALEVSPGVLIPRPETELLVEAALSRLSHSTPLHILDVGTGTGAIAIAIASRLPLARVTALDISATALGIAAQNIRRHTLEAQIELVASNLLAGLPDPSLRFDAILSNPPYVPDGDRASMHPEVRDFEPPEALFGGSDGLDVYRNLIPQAKSALRDGGLLALEIGFGQHSAIANLLHGWNSVEFLPDLQRIPRVAIALRR